MSDATASGELPNVASPNRDWRATNFAFSILLSAFLLFQVQPLVSKFILPWFGGSPAVWTTCMLFFQALLFFGYGYAHWTTQKLGPQKQALLHGVLLLAAATLCPIVPSDSFKPSDDSFPALRIFLLLTSCVGLPYFVLSATGPLLQSWYARVFPGRSPYRLYALSNFGSLVALLSYPVAFEPLFDAVTQARLWRAGFWVFTALCAVAALTNSQVGSVVEEKHVVRSSAPVQPGTRLAWLGLPAAASVMLLATTNHVCQDVAAIPFLWVAPLALYLLTFIIAFDHPRWYARRAYAVAATLLCLVVGCLGSVDSALGLLGGSINFGAELLVHLALLFTVCLLCHGELVRLRPDATHLTEFYLLMSAGGALGGTVVSLIAPAVFHTFFEWHAGLVASFIGSALLVFRTFRLGQKRAGSLVFGFATLAGALAIGREQFDFDPDELEVKRNFYGVVGVYDVDQQIPDQRHRSLTHGTIVHGRQFYAPEKRALPLAYYSAKSGVGRAVTHFLSRPDMRLGVVGLGVGTLATYLQPGQSARFYEINPQVKELADRYFTYLADSKGQLEFSMGDARISLERENPQGFHVLVLDAFSGDSVPVHLLTQEAFAVYSQHLRPEGIIAVNITNHNLDLSSIVASVGERYGFDALRLPTEGSNLDQLYPAVWMLLSRDASVLAAIPHLHDEEFTPTRHSMWTDRYSDLLSVLK